MSYSNYNLDKEKLYDSYTKANQNIKGVNPYDDTYKSFEAIHIESENILRKEQIIFNITSTITAFLTIYTLQTILK